MAHARDSAHLRRIDCDALEVLHCRLLTIVAVGPGRGNWLSPVKRATGVQRAAGSVRIPANPIADSEPTAASGSLGRRKSTVRALCSQAWQSRCPEKGSLLRRPQARMAAVLAPGRECAEDPGDMATLLQAAAGGNAMWYSTAVRTCCGSARAGPRRTCPPGMPGGPDIPIARTAPVAKRRRRTDAG